MSIERDVLAVLSNKEAYLRYSSRILAKGSALTRETAQIIKDMRQYYEHFDASVVDWSSFSQWFLLVQHPMYAEDTVVVYKAHFDKLQEHVEPTALQEDIIHALLEQSIAEDIAVVSGKVAEGNDRHGLDEVKVLMDTWQESLVEEEEDEDEWDLETLLEDSYGEGGYKWRMEELNVSCGPLRESNLVLFGARPNVGKTTMITSEVSYMAGQIADDRCVLAIHNEEGPKYKLQLRWLQSTIGWTPAQINADKDGAMREYVNLLGNKDRVIVRHMPGATVTEIEALLVKYNPAIIVVDQLRLCGGFGKNNTEVERLKDLYRWARIQASKYGPFLTVHQAGDAAEGSMFPAGNMLEGCKTEIQGALDLQIMIGCPNANENKRGLNIVKNKLAGSIDSDPAMRHCTWEVQITPTTARYEGNL